MSRGIRVSQTHGVNPTIPVCFWCGKEKNEIALLGMLPGDAEAPKNTVVDYSPCDHCAAIWTQSLAVIEVSQHPNTKNQPAWSKKHSGVYPTGRFLVLRREAVAEHLRDSTFCFAYRKDFDEILANMEVND